MTGSRLLSPVFLALVLGAAPAFAQGGQPAAAKPAAEAATGEAARGAPAQAPAPAEKAGNPRSPEKGADARGNSPFDYSASEQISEDLPVSFPADI